MGRAEDVAALLVEEAIFDPVEAHGDVPALVYVRVVLTSPVDEEAFDLALSKRQHELLRLARRDLAEPRDPQPALQSALPTPQRSAPIESILTSIVSPGATGPTPAG